jgi:hypothetical protein
MFTETQTDRLLRLALANRQAVGTKRQTDRLAQIGRQTDWLKKADRQVGAHRQAGRLE